MEDSYMYRIKEECENLIEIEKSRFITYLFRVFSEEEAKANLLMIQKLHPNATHHCYAFIIGAHDEIQRSNDNGEPAGTAGVPMLESLKRHKMQDTLAITVRYFGGIKLGTGGLIVAYKAAAAEALDKAEVVEKTIDLTLEVFFEYPMMNDVMRIVKEEEPMVVEQDFQMDCRLRLSIRASRMSRLRERYEQLEIETGRIRVEEPKG